MGAAFSISVIGASSIIRSFRKASKEVGSETRKNLLKAGSVIQGKAKKNFRPRSAKGVPNPLRGPKTLRVQSGQLRRSIRVRARGTGFDTVVEIGPTVRYAGRHEEPEPGDRMPARPYMRPALEETEKQVVALVGKSFRPVLRA